MKIPVSKPSITDLERKYVQDAMQSGWVSSKGPYIEKFEQAWAEKNDYANGVACSSGTNALFLALKALGIREGDEVIVPDFTMVATAWAVTYCGSTPVFVDCRSDLNIDVTRIESAITSKTKAIMPVHIYGRQCDMDSIMKIAREYSLYVVEDMAEAHGVQPRGDIACYSFFGNKIITTGEGGVCLTNDGRLAEQMRHLRSMAFDEGHTFLHKKIGYNMRMTNIQAALGLAQVERFDEILKKRKRIEGWYDKFLKLKSNRNVLWMYDILVTNRDKVVKTLTDAGIETRLFFKPMTTQLMYRGRQPVGPLALDASQKGLYLPTYTDMTRKEVEYVCKTLKSIL